MAATLVVAVSSAALAACETTQDKARALQEQGAAQVAAEVGVSVGKPNQAVKVVDSFVLSDQYGDAVAVELQNTSKQAQVNLPIVIDVLDAKGKSVYSNNVPGLDESLTHVPLLRPGETTYWVNDQLQPSGTPKSVKVKVGASEEQAPAKLPELTVSSPRLNNDPSGIEVEGRVTNDSQVTQQQLVLFAVARAGQEVVAAGRGQFKKLDAGGKPLNYNIFFIGDPRGADIEVLAPPTDLQ
jgi:hypothetical protein